MNKKKILFELIGLVFCRDLGKVQLLQTALKTTEEDNQAIQLVLMRTGQTLQ